MPTNTEIVDQYVSRMKALRGPLSVVEASRRIHALIPDRFKDPSSASQAVYKMESPRRILPHPEVHEAVAIAYGASGTELDALRSLHSAAREAAQRIARQRRASRAHYKRNRPNLVVSKPALPPAKAPAAPRSSSVMKTVLDEMKSRRNALDQAIKVLEGEFA